MEKAASSNLIDFKQRSSELRIKSTFTGSVPDSEVAQALAFGLIYLQGEGVERDLAKAAGFLAVAAKGGIAQAKHELAQLHLDGSCVAYDVDYSISLLQSASDDGFVASTILLAELYLFGKHCPTDVDKVLELLYRVVFKAEPAAMYYLAYVYDRNPKHKNSFEAAYWYRRAAEHGHFKSQVRLASLYAIGDGVPQCPETAEAFLGVALETRHEQDPRFLLWQGELLGSLPETEFLAQALVKAAAEMQYTPAQRMLLQRGWRSGKLRDGSPNPGNPPT
jgi:TPR repeat protein